ncbi:amidase family protein [Alkalihalobacterium elongatum]|uniref:amidase family protein n=1 Tax=Alkalihalobacterium elongatum TaxID=2675466 RepID=UPI001EEF12FD|nr:amidase family protein [Alkalihalobacterium elongatum]
MKVKNSIKSIVVVTFVFILGIFLPMGAAFAQSPQGLANKVNPKAAEAVSKNPTAAKATGLQSFQIEETTIAEVQRALQTNRITSVELVQMYLDRIEEYDKNGPGINSIISVNPEALEIAAEMDKIRGKGNQGPLHGIPVILKDNIDSKDNMPTTAGTIALKDNYATEDSFVAKQLREAGAIILGKANMSEWAYFMTTGAPSGYSGLGGQVLHPYGPDTFATGSVGGSSSGTGAGIAANFALVGIGSETSGSILSPSSANSLVGIKPTVGLISRTGIIPLSSTQDTAGPMTRTVTDAAITLGVLTGIDETDPITKTSEGKSLTDYTPHLKKDGLQGARIGIDYSFAGGNGQAQVEQRRILEEAIEEMKAQGAIIEQVTIPRPPSSHSSIVLWHDFKHDLNAYLSKVSDDVPVKSLADVIEFNKQDPDVRMRFGQVHLERAQGMSDDPLDPTYLDHREKDYRYNATEGIDVVMAEHDLDALLFINNRGAGMPARAGYPSITVPAGYSNVGMPVGVTFTGMAYSEARLIELAYSYEQATQKRVAPSFE